MQPLPTLQTEALDVVFNSSSGKFQQGLGCLERPDTDCPVSTSRRRDCPWPKHSLVWGESCLVAGMLLAWAPDSLRHLENPKQKSQWGLHP